MAAMNGPTNAMVCPMIDENMYMLTNYMSTSFSVAVTGDT